MRLVTAQERLSRRRGAHIAIFGESGIGKTTLCRGLPPAESLFLDMEGGTLALAEWPGNVLEGVRTWDHARAIACIIGGPDPSKSDGEAYSTQDYQKCSAQYPAEAQAIESAHYIFWDSITELSRICAAWAKKQPLCLSNKGIFDQWAWYRLIADEMIALLKHIQQRHDKSLIMVGILEQKKDAYGRLAWEPQMVGAKTADELPGIFDNIASMVDLVSHNGALLLGGGQPPELDRFRALVCHKINPWSVPAKDRSGRVNMLEQPDLLQLLTKMTTAPRHDTVSMGLIHMQPPAAQQGALQQ